MPSEDRLGAKGMIQPRLFELAEALCSACGESQRLRQDGTLPIHYRRQIGRYERCHGSREFPSVVRA